MRRLLKLNSNKSSSIDEQLVGEVKNMLSHNLIKLYDVSNPD